VFDVDLVRGKAPLKVQFEVSLVQDVFNTMSIVVVAPQYEGFDQWVYATYAALPADLKADMEVVLTLVGKFSPLNQLPFDHPAHSDFSALVAHLTALDEETVRHFVEASLEEGARYCQEKFGQEFEAPLVEDAEALKDCLCKRGLDEKHADEAVRLVHHPAELKARLISIVTRFWDAFYREEFARFLPMMERSVEYHCEQNYGGDLLAVFTAVTGRLFPKEADSYEDVERVVFVPSAHIGPYVTFREVEGPPATLFLVYNCRPTGAPERDREIPAIQNIFPPLKALADETRLQIVSILDGQELYAQQIVERLDISQSAVSRHLQLMVTGDVLNVRKEDSMKYYSLNEETLAALAARLNSFRAARSE